MMVQVDDSADCVASIEYSLDFHESSLHFSSYYIIILHWYRNIIRADALAQTI